MLSNQSVRIDVSMRAFHFYFRIYFPIGSVHLERQSPLGSVGLRRRCVLTAKKVLMVRAFVVDSVWCFRQYAVHDFLGLSFPYKRCQETLNMRKSLWVMLGVLFVAVVGSLAVRRVAGSSVIVHAFVPGVGFFNPAGSELVNVTVESTNAGYMLIYNVFDFGGGFSAGGAGSIPASSVNVSGGSVNAEKVTVTLNVNTCDVTGFTTTDGPCGTFDLTWVEQPASVGGSIATRGDTQQTFPGGVKVVTNGETVTFFAVTTGTALGFDVPSGGTVGILKKETNVTKTITHP